MAPTRPTKSLPRVSALEDGQPWRLRVGKVAPWFCCDCGLVHDITLVEAENGVAVVRLTQRPRMTAAYRRRARLKMVPK